MKKLALCTALCASLLATSTAWAATESDQSAAAIRKICPMAGKALAEQRQKGVTKEQGLKNAKIEVAKKINKMKGVEIKGEDYEKSADAMLSVMFDADAIGDILTKEIWEKPIGKSEKDKQLVISTIEGFMEESVCPELFALIALAMDQL